MTAVSSPRNPARVKVSEYFNLNRQQYELDFVDVDIWGDVPLYIDPGALRQSDDPWAQQCVSLLQDFFAEVLNAIRAGNRSRAQDLLPALREPNDTHLGLSKIGLLVEPSEVGTRTSLSITFRKAMPRVAGCLPTWRIRRCSFPASHRTSSRI